MNKYLFLLVTIFGILIILDCEFFPNWKTGKIHKLYGKRVGSYRSGTSMVSKLELDEKTIEVPSYYAGDLRKMSEIEIQSSLIFNIYQKIKIQRGDSVKTIKLFHGITNAYYLFPVILIISSLLYVFSSSGRVKGYSFLVAIIVLGFTLYVLIAN